jgi:ubiquinone/menaquinone biosynthesis C-methylase UbiE
MYAFHESPYQGRSKILQEAKRLLRPGGTCAIVDISVDYSPTDTMLSGEPYFLEYQANIRRQLDTTCAKKGGFSPPWYKTLVPGHAGMWLLKRVVDYSQ